MKIKNILFFALFIISLGCSKAGPPNSASVGSQPLSTQSSKEFNPKKVHDIAVAPLLSGLTHQVSEGELLVLGKELQSAYEGATSLTVLNAKDSVVTAGAVEKFKHQTATPKERAVYFGRALGAQAVLFGQIEKYQGAPTGGRVGKEALDVQFRLWLVDVEQGAELWNAAYRLKEETFTDNILNIGKIFSERARFKAPVEAVQEGFLKSAKALESFRENYAASTSLEK